MTGVQRLRARNTRYPISHRSVPPPSPPLPTPYLPVYVPRESTSIDGNKGRWGDNTRCPPLTLRVGKGALLKDAATCGKLRPYV